MNHNNRFLCGVDGARSDTPTTVISTPSTPPKRNRWKIIILILIILLLLGLIHFPLLFAPVRKDLQKTWTGNAADTVTNIRITMDNGTQVGYWGSIPPNHRTYVDNVYHGQYATITWNDVNGAHSEIVGPVLCNGNDYEITNVVSYSLKTGATTQTLNKKHAIEV